MDVQSGRFRVYRVVESVHHLNLQSVDAPQLYTVYQSGYGEQLQAAVDDLRTGDLVDAELAGDEGADAEAWRFRHVERVDRVRMDFAVGVEPPDVARDLWDEDLAEPTCAVLREAGDGVGVCCVQPRAALPEGLFVPNVLAGLLPIEPHLESLLEIGEPAVTALFLDPDPPEAAQFSYPYGVVLFFAEDGTALEERFRDTYDLPRTGDTRPDYDPYAL